MTNLGEFPNELDLYRETDWFVFFLCAVFNMLVLLNLLIAIISKTHETVSETEHESAYKEKVLQIRYLQDSIYGGIKAKFNPMEFIFVANPIDSSEL